MQEKTMTSTTPKTPDSKVQGEGDYEAARRYDEAARGFAQAGKAEPAVATQFPLFAAALAR